MAQGRSSNMHEQKQQINTKSQATGTDIDACEASFQDGGGTGINTHDGQSNHDQNSDDIDDQAQAQVIQENTDESLDIDEG